jgi:hypothetical protein
VTTPLIAAVWIIGIAAEPFVEAELGPDVGGGRIAVVVTACL